MIGLQLDSVHTAEAFRLDNRTDGLGRQLMAIFGWTTGKMAQHYTRSTDRARLARDAARLLLPVQSANEKRPHLADGAGENSKLAGKSGE